MTELPRRVSGLLASSAFRLAAISAAAFVLLASGLVAIVFWQANAVLTDQVVATLSAEADALRTEGRSGRAGLLDAVAARSRPEGPGLYVLVDSTGRKLAGNLSRVPPEVLSDASGGVFRYRPITVNSSAPVPPERLAVAMQIVMPDGDRLVVGRDIEDQRRYADGVKRLVIAGFVALSLIGIGVAAMISRLVLKRIEAINSAARQVMAGDFARRVPVDGSGDELDGLAVNLNAMLERIVELMAGMREVSDNIAHDLKTPLNRLRNRVEGALRHDDAVAHKEALERTIEEADELIRTFNALLLIARLEASTIDDSATDVDLGKLVAGVVELYAPVAEEAGARLNFAPMTGPALLLRANGQLLQQAVANLVDNAIKYATLTRPGAASCDTTAGSSGVIRVALAVENGEALITVADSGPGIPAADRERALRRFVRLDASRTQPGTGLGLSLVAAVARLHGGRVVLSDTIDGTDMPETKMPETKMPGTKTPGTKMPGLTVRLALPGTLVRGAAASGAQPETATVGTVPLDADSTTDVRNANLISVAGARGVGHNARV